MLCTTFFLIALLQPFQAPVAKVAASTVSFTGQETLQDAVKLLNGTGNVVEQEGQASNPKLALTGGTQTFWQALAAVCQQAHLIPQWRGDRLVLLPHEATTRPIAIDGPFQIAVKQCSVTNHFNQPDANRLTLQLELSSEPRLHPLLFKLSSDRVRWEPTYPTSEKSRQGPVLTYRFDEGKFKLFDVRLPKPPRSVTKLTSLALEGTVWVSPSRLDFETNLLVGAKGKKQGTICQITGIDVDDVGKTWEIAVKLTYPESSLDWESNQAGLLGKTTMVLVNEKKQRIPAVGQDVRSDQGRQLEIRWLFRDVPGQAGAWRALIQTPSAPVAFPLKVKLQNIELP